MKLYFVEQTISDVWDEYAYNLKYILAKMKEDGITELKVFKAEREIGTDYFFCRAIDEVGLKYPKGDGCGRWCPDYIPRNGKNGCCKHRGFCYEKGDEFILNINGKLIAAK